MRALAIVCLLIATAHADDKARIVAARKLLDTQLTGEFAEANGVAKRPGVVATFPGHLIDGNVMGWRFGPPYIGKIKIANSVAGWSGDWGWVAAELIVTQQPYVDSSAGNGPAKPEVHHYHLVQVYMTENGKLSVVATQLVDTRPDGKLVHAEPLPGGPPTNGSLLWNLVSPGQLELSVNDNVAVLGTGDSEVGLGQAAAKKLLASWKKLDLGMVGTPKEIVVGDLGVGVSEVDLMLKGKSVRLRAMVVARKTVTAGKPAWEVIALSYGSDSEFGDPKH